MKLLPNICASLEKHLATNISSETYKYIPNDWDYYPQIKIITNKVSNYYVSLLTNDINIMIERRNKRRQYTNLLNGDLVLLENGTFDRITYINDLFFKICN